MIVNNNVNTSICFSARKIGSIQALKYKKDGRFVSQKLNLLEIDTSKTTDMMCIHSINKNWKKENKKLKNDSNYYLSNIYDVALKKYEQKKGLSEYYNNVQIFAVTKQKFLLNLLNPKKICAIAQMRIANMDIPMLDFIQVKPKYQHANANRKMKNIGTGLLEKLSVLTNHKKYGLIVDGKSKEFYTHYGAYPDENWSGRFYIYD